MQETPTSQQPLPQEHTVYTPSTYEPPQHTVYPPQPPMYPPPTYQPPQKPPRSRKRLWIILGIVAAVILVLSIIGSNIGTQEQTTTTPQATQPAQQVTTQPVPTQAPTEVSQPTPTVAPKPTQSPAEIEKAFKSSTQATTITELDKEGNGYKGKNVYFTCTLSSFVKDSDGNTAGANVTDENYSSFVQIAFPPGTDLAKLNKGDTLEVWGTDAGTFSGENAFGGTIQEVGVAAMYITDQTTGYATH